MPVKPNFIPRILIVDDEAFNLEFLEIVLEQNGYDTLTASNGRMARTIAEKEKPDLILLDILMPGENGFECAMALRLSPESCQIPIIFLSALNEAGKVAKGYDAGAVDFIVKPFEYENVLQRIRMHLQISRNDRVRLYGGLEQRTQASEIFPSTGSKSSLHISGTLQPENCIYENLVLPNDSEGHLLINLNTPLPVPAPQKEISSLLAENSGPLYIPQVSMRNISARLSRFIEPQDFPTGTFVHVDRANDLLTVVNAGAQPAIFLQKDKGPVLIERQSGPMGSLGMGIPPCSTKKLGKGERLFIFSNSMLNDFKTPGEGILELCEACELSSRVDIDTACLAVGEMMQKQGTPLNGILIGVEN